MDRERKCDSHLLKVCVGLQVVCLGLRTSLQGSSQLPACKPEGSAQSWPWLPSIQQESRLHGSQVSPLRQALLPLAGCSTGAALAGIWVPAHMYSRRIYKLQRTAQAHRLCSLSFSAISWAWRSLSRRISLCTSTCEHSQAEQQVIHGRPAQRPEHLSKEQLVPAWRPLPWESGGICLTAHAGTGTHLQVADALACMVHSSIRTLQRHEKVSSNMIRRHCKLDKPHSRGACAALTIKGTAPICCRGSYGHEGDSCTHACCPALHSITVIYTAQMTSRTL